MFNIPEENRIIHKQVIANIIPAIIVEIMMLIYNLADTFFIAQTNDPLQLAAVSLAAPVFLVLIAMGIIFMAGAMSFISRSLGAGQSERANNIASFCVWSGVSVGAVMAVIFMFFIERILRAIGASPETFRLAYDYLSIVIASSPFVLFSMACGGIMRAENHASGAMLGQIIGNMLNVILDPVMILYFGWGIKGAAIATSVSIIIGALYYMGYFLSGHSTLSIHIKHFRIRNGIAWGVLSIGIPSCLDLWLMSISQIIMNSLMSFYGDMAVAAAGVVMRIDQITGLFAMGTGQGVQPLLGFCVGAENWKRYRIILNFALKFTITLSLMMIALCYIFTHNVVSVFLTEPEAFTYAVKFLHIKLSSSILFAIFFIYINALQAMGAGRASFILSVCRQCALYMPLLFILNHFAGEFGIIWALPVAELLSLLQTVIVYGKIIYNPRYLIYKETL
ncbi:MAG: MATE family efflux transporter [Synergistaceae bacterium]|nr:MATE family efflux transporter [Synergistaceae bacterium]